MRRTISSLTTVSVVTLAALASGDASAAVGGPDTAGYTFADQADGAVYNYVDITATGMVVASGDENLGAAFALAAPFQFYGVAANNVRVSSNGFITSPAATSADFSNDCPLPAIPGGGGFRIAALHDDLVTNAFYQYFDEVQAAALGFPGETAGISVIQWTGDHFSGPADDFVDFEAILFHDDFSILTMVALDVENGLSSTLGIQSDGASTGLNYTCNTGGGVIPGVTAVQYTLGAPPDSDCCNASPTGSPGCTHPTCQSAVCAVDPSCCDTAWDGLCAVEAQTECPIACLPPPPVNINEIRIDQSGTDNDEFFELVGPPGTVFTDVQYLVIGENGTTPGSIEAVVDLTGTAMPPSGYMVVAEGSFTIGAADFTTSLNFENTDTVTHMLVGGFTGSVGQNLDPDANGTLDVTPWLTVLDTVAVVHGPSTDIPYGPPLACMAGPLCQEVTDPVTGNAPFQTFRCDDGLGTWQVGLQDAVAVPPSDSPGAANPCVCGDGIVITGEACDDAGESAACNPDCTVAACGDGFLNVTAGEVCDDAGESALCDTDCTMAMCGDTVLNVSAGEICDDGGESAACNADCTVAICGDMIVNNTAGETCDDGGRSAMCDADCTAVTCGDGLVNLTAGEECDGDGMGVGGETDVCDDDCTSAMCGDAVVNVTAMEECDDGGESETCNDDCTSAACGDGVINATAMEECDDGGESETCNDDCTSAACGDGVINATAGEECDDGGESKGCDDDCTISACGDGLLNTTAGEECDDGNTDDGDGCAADCTEEAEPGTTGGSTGGSDSGSDSGGVDETGGNTGATTGGPGPVTAADGSSGGQTDGDTEMTPVPGVGDDGCNCSTTGDRNGRNALWSMLALFGLGALRRRRRA